MKVDLCGIGVLFQYCIYILRRDKSDRVRLVLMHPGITIYQMSYRIHDLGLRSCRHTNRKRKGDEEDLECILKKYSLPFWYLYCDYSGFVAIVNIASQEQYAQIGDEEEDPEEGMEPYIYYGSNEGEIEDLQKLPRRWWIIAAMVKKEE